MEAMEAMEGESAPLGVNGQGKAGQTRKRGLSPLTKLTSKMDKAIKPNEQIVCYLLRQDEGKRAAIR